MAQWEPTIESGAGFITVPESGWCGEPHIEAGAGFITVPEAGGGFITVPESGARNRIQGGWLTEAGARNRIQGGWLTEAGARNRIQGGWLTEAGAGFLNVPESGLSFFGDDPPAYSFLGDEDPSSEYSFDAGSLTLDPDLEADMDALGITGGEDDEAGGVDASGGMSDADALKWGAQAGEYLGTATDLILGLLGKQGGTVPPPTDYAAAGYQARAPSTLRRVLPIAAGIAAVGGIVYFLSMRSA